MIRGSAPSRPKDRKSNENPTAPVLGFSCSAFADHPPSTRLGGQQNKNTRTESVGLREVVKNNNKINQRIKNQRARSQRSARWEAGIVEIVGKKTMKREMSERLEEVAHAIYEHLCQLVKIQSPLENTEAVSPLLRRTGTDG